MLRGLPQRLYFQVISDTIQWFHSSATSERSRRNTLRIIYLIISSRRSSSFVIVDHSQSFCTLQLDPASRQSLQPPCRDFRKDILTCTGGGAIVPDSSALTPDSLGRCRCRWYGGGGCCSRWNSRRGRRWLGRGCRGGDRSWRGTYWYGRGWRGSTSCITVEDAATIRSDVRSMIATLSVIHNTTATSLDTHLP